GKNVIYQIELSNTGSDAMTQLDVIAKIPPELKAISAKGPTENKIDLKAGTVAFAKLPALPAGQTVKYEINCIAEKPGDVRFRVDVTSASLKQPVYEEESTTIVNPAALLNAPPITVAPSGPAAVPVPTIAPPG